MTGSLTRLMSLFVVGIYRERMFFKTGRSVCLLRPFFYVRYIVAQKKTRPSWGRAFAVTADVIVLFEGDAFDEITDIEQVRRGPGQFLPANSDIIERNVADAAVWGIAANE